MMRLALFILLALFLTTTSVYAEIAVFDDFNDNTVNTDFWSAGSASSGVTVAETNERVEISFAPTASGDSFGGGCTGKMKLGGDFDLQVDYILLEWPQSNGVRIGLSAVSPQNIGYIVERVSFEGGGDYCEKYLAFRNGMDFIAVTTDHQTGKLRLTRVGDLMSYYYYGDSDWELISSIPTTTEDMVFTIGAWSHDYCFCDSSVTFAFDNFKLTTVPEPSMVALLVFGSLGLIFLLKRNKSNFFHRL